MKELIKALQENKEPFGLMSTDEFTNEEMVLKATVIGKREFEALNSEVDWCLNTGIYWVKSITYRLRPDYEEEPEIIECEVFTEGNRLRFISPRNENWTLDFALRLPDFIGFKYEDGNIYPQPVMYSENGGFHFISQIESFASGKDIANRPTHVLFRSTK